jgi:membrane-associated protease RseP (regulator of RpoE activity)
VESVLLYVLGVLIVLVGLIVSIGLHEVGHLVPAKLFGVKVTQYMIGFGRTLFSRRRGETEYGLKLIPLGGYISMIGMYPPSKTGGAARNATTSVFEAMVQEGSAVKTRRDARQADAGAGDPDAALDSGAGASVPIDQSPDARVEVVSAGATDFPPLDEGERRRFFGSMADDAREASAETIGEGEDHRAFYRLPVYKRIIIMLGGPVMNLVLAFVFFGISLVAFGAPVQTTTLSLVSECVLPAGSTKTACDASDPLAPGAAAGLKPGDTIVSIDGAPVTTWAESTDIIRRSSGEALDVVIERGGTEQSVTLTPLLTKRYVYDTANRVVENADGSPQTEEVGFVGISSTQEVQQQPITATGPMVWQSISGVGDIIIHLPQRMGDVLNAAFGPGERDPNGPISVVGVGRIAGEVAASDQIPFVSKGASLFAVLGSLNIALFVINLVPLMPLDGGHVVTALWEGIRRFFAKLFGRPDPGPVDAAKLMPLTFVVVIFFMAMSAILIYADIVKPANLFG